MGPFFNAASYGLLPASVVRAGTDLVERRHRADGFEEAELGEVPRRARAAVARLLDASPEEIALAPNTSFGIGLGVALARTRASGRVIVSDGEFPANVLPWRALERDGWTVERVPTDGLGQPDEARLLERLDAPDTRVLTVSAVQYDTGYRMDLQALGARCRERGILFCVDAIQLLGAATLAPAEVGADVVACGGQKWLCAPWGSGFAWIAREHHDAFDPPMPSWLAFEGATRLTGSPDYGAPLLGDARRFELATLGVQDYAALGRAAELFAEIGAGTIAEHLDALLAPLFEWARGRDDVVCVTPEERSRRAGIVSFRLPDPRAVEAALREAGVAAAVRGGVLRFSPHFYNRFDEVEWALDVLDDALGPAGRRLRRPGLSA